MKITSHLAIAVLLLAAIGVSGCADTKIPREEHSLETSLTWQNAKTDTQTTALEIASLIPNDKVTSIVQKETGVLLSCNKTEHNWNGWTSITLTEGSVAESVVTELETAARSHYTGRRFEVSGDRTVQGTFCVEIGDQETSEMYLIREDDPGVIRIASGSPCFTLPRTSIQVGIS